MAINMIFVKTWPSISDIHHFETYIICTQFMGLSEDWGDTQFGSFIIGKLMINSGMWSDHIWPRNQFYLVGRFDGIYTLLAMKPRETWWLTMLDFGVYTIFIYTIYICIHTRHIIYIYVLYTWYTYAIKYPQPNITPETQLGYQL